MTTSLAVLSKSFGRDLRAEGANEATIYKYLATVRLFSDWLTAEDLPATLDSVNRHTIKDWLGALTEIGKMPNTVRLRKAGMSKFCTWLVTEGEMASNPLPSIKVPAADVVPVPVLTDDQLTALVKACTGTRFSDRRDEAMIRMLLDTGIRANELLTMTVDAINLDDDQGGSAWVHGKYSKDRMVYFGTKTARAVDRYLRARNRHRAATSDRLWLSQRGPISYDGMTWSINQRATKARLGTHLRPHMFRHTWASTWLSAGGGETDLMRLAGWVDRDMLSRYGMAAADARAASTAKRLRLGDRL